jgi:hypothetical protein
MAVGRDPGGRTWYFIVDLPAGPEGKRRQMRRRGFANERNARDAQREALASFGNASFAADGTVAAEPYVAVVAPFRCGGSTRRGQTCRLVGWGLLVGCSYHRFDRLARVFGQDRGRRASRYQAQQGPVLAAASGGIPRPVTTAGGPTRPRAFDLLTLALTGLGTVAGWLALFVNPGSL